MRRLLPLSRIQSWVSKAWELGEAGKSWDTGRFLLGFLEVGVNCGSLWLEFRSKGLPAELTVTWGIHSLTATPKKNIRDSSSLDTGRI